MRWNVDVDLYHEEEDNAAKVRIYHNQIYYTKDYYEEGDREYGNLPQN